MGNGHQLKQPKTFDEQLDILIQRNMLIEDGESALQTLQTLQYINYYRRTAYALAYKLKDVYQDGLSFPRSIRYMSSTRSYTACNYRVPHHYIQSWLHSLTLIRNICAHYGRRIYGKLLSIKPKLHRTDIKKGVDNRTFFSVLFITGKLRSKDTEWISFITSLAALMENYSVVDISRLGFPNNWEDILATL